jgi:hypothetical protein
MGNPISGQSKDWAAGERIRALGLNRIGDSNAQNVGVFPGAFDYGGRFPGGTIRVPNSAGSAPPVLYPPWWPFVTGSAGSYSANFYAGTVGGIVPSNMFSAVALTASSVNYLYLAVTASGGIVTGATITASTTYPTLAASNSGSPPTSFNIPIAIFDLTGSAPVVHNIVGFGNIWVQPYVSLLTTNSTGALLTAPFTVSYNWEWGAGN